MSTAVLHCPATPIGGGGGGGGFANTVAGQWVQDSLGNVYWLETPTDAQGVTSYIYYDQPGGVVVTPTGGTGPIQDSNIKVIPRGDDINGDGSQVVTFYRLNIYDADGSILVSIPQTADGLAYVIQGNEIDPQDEIENLLIESNQNTTALSQRAAGSFINFNFDQCDLTYIASGPAAGEIETAVYKLGPSVVGTITLSYDPITGDLIKAIRV